MSWKIGLRLGDIRQTSFVLHHFRKRHTNSGVPNLRIQLDSEFICNLNYIHNLWWLHNSFNDYTFNRFDYLILDYTFPLKVFEDGHLWCFVDLFESQPLFTGGNGDKKRLLGLQLKFLIRRFHKKSVIKFLTILHVISVITFYLRFK